MTDHNGMDPQAYQNFGVGASEQPTSYMPSYPASDNYMAAYPYGGIGYAPQPMGMDKFYGAPTSEKDPYGSSFSPQYPYAPQNNYDSAANPPTSSYYAPGYAQTQGTPSAFNAYPPQSSYVDPYNNYVPQSTYDWSAQQSGSYPSSRYPTDPYAAQPTGAWQGSEGYRGAVPPQMPQDQTPPYFGAPQTSGYRPVQPQAPGSYYESRPYPAPAADPQAPYGVSVPPSGFETPRFERRVFQASDIQRQQANSQQMYGHQPSQISPSVAPYGGTIPRPIYPGRENYPVSENLTTAPAIQSVPAAAPHMPDPSMAFPAGMDAPVAASSAIAPPVSASFVADPHLAAPTAPETAGAEQPQTQQLLEALPAQPAVSAFSPAQETAPSIPTETTTPVVPSTWPDSPPVATETAVPSHTPESTAAAPEPMFFAPDFFAQTPPVASAPSIYAAPSETAQPAVTISAQNDENAPAQGLYDADTPSLDAAPISQGGFPDASLDPAAFSTGGLSFPGAPSLDPAPVSQGGFPDASLDPAAFSTGGLSFPGAPSFDSAPVSQGGFPDVPSQDQTAGSIDGLTAPEAAQPAQPLPLEKNIFESGFTINPAERNPAKMRQTQLGNTEIFRIAEELSQAVLVKSLNRAFNDNNLMPESDTTLVSVHQIFSDYYVSESGEPPYRMFEGLSFELRAGCCCILISDLSLSAYALARSICESADKGGPNEPVTVAQLADGYPGQVMYIGSDSMLPDEMTCKEFLLYTQGGGEEDPEAENERLDALFTQLGAGNLIDTDLRDLSYNKRILLLVLAAALNPNIICVVVNDPKFSVGSEEEMLARRIFALVNNRGKCSMISCASDHLMASVANRVAVVKNGRLLFFDSYRRFLDEYCLGIMTFSAENPQEIAAALEPRFPGINVLCKDNFVYIIRRKGSLEISLETLISDVIHMGVDYSTIVMDDKSFAVACKEAFGK